MSASERLPQPDQNNSNGEAIKRAKQQSRRIQRTINQSKKTTQRAARRLRRSGH